MLKLENAVFSFEQQQIWQIFFLLLSLSLHSEKYREFKYWHPCTLNLKILLAQQSYKKYEEIAYYLRNWAWYGSLKNIPGRVHHTHHTSIQCPSSSHASHKQHIIFKVSLCSQTVEGYLSILHKVLQLTESCITSDQFFFPCYSHILSQHSELMHSEVSKQIHVPLVHLLSLNQIRVQ